MTGKLIGALLLALGLLGILLLTRITKRQPRSHASSSVKKYRLSHEYDNKGFSEKGQSEGILDIPTTSESLVAHNAEHHLNTSDLSYTTDDHATPGDTF